MNKRLVAGFASIFAITTAKAGATTISCSTVSACIFGSNASTGIGVEGGSKTGMGVAGISTAGFGVSGVSASGYGVNGKSASSFGVVGITTANSTSRGSARAGIYGEDLSTNKKTFNSGVIGMSISGYGGFFTSTHGVGLYASGAELAGPTTTVIGSADGVDIEPSGGLHYNYGNPSHAAIRLFANQNAYDNGGGDNIFVGSRCLSDPSAPVPVLPCGDVVSIDANGNAMFQGTVTQAGTALFRTRTAVGSDVASFGSRSTTPSIEDVGKAELHYGTAYVALDRTFASTIDPRVAYSVFITPEGDSNSLYTSELNQKGFVVRESKAGRSTLTFDYRIIAKPLDSETMHLPAMSLFPRLAKHVSLPKMR